jgi:adenine-specific DNA-methyltransferase
LSSALAWRNKEAIKLHAAWWEARIARQKEIDASIAAIADYEYRYDKPYIDKDRVRVAGPFTVESLSPHRTLAVDWNDELIDIVRAAEGKREAPDRDKAATDFAQMILENLKAAGVQQAHKEDRITFTGGLKGAGAASRSSSGCAASMGSTTKPNPWSFDHDCFFLLAA